MRDDEQQTAASVDRFVDFKRPVTASADVLTIEGDALFDFVNGGSDNQLRAGTIFFRGNLQVGGSEGSYESDAGHRSVFDGPAAQSVDFFTGDVAAEARKRFHRILKRGSITI